MNNVGKSHPYPEYYHDVPEQIIEDILAINVVATARVTRMIVPHMVQKCAGSCFHSFFEWLIDMSTEFVLVRRRGLILSLASFSGVSVPSPMLAPYAGSKSFLASFTTSLGEELKGKGIDVECANTYFVVCVHALLLSCICVHDYWVYRCVVASFGLIGVQYVKDSSFEYAHPHTETICPSGPVQGAYS